MSRAEVLGSMEMLPLCFSGVRCELCRVGWEIKPSVSAHGRNSRAQNFSFEMGRAGLGHGREQLGEVGFCLSTLVS